MHENASNHDDSSNHDNPDDHDNPDNHYDNSRVRQNVLKLPESA